MNKSYWSVLKNIVAIVGTVFGIYSYFASIQEREPTFIVDPIKPVLIDEELTKNKPLKISDSFGREINTNVSVLTFYFFNQGEESIRNENVLKPIKISLPGECRILDYRILKTSRDVTNVSLKNYDSLTESLEINFRILEKNDGITGQITYEGSKNAPLSISGVIEGVNSIGDKYSKFLYTKALFIGMWLIIILWPIYIFFLSTNKKKKSANDEAPSNPQKSKVRRRTLSDWLTNRYQLVVRNEENLAEKHAFNFTYAKVIIVTTTMYTLLITGSLFLSKTLLAKWMDPAYKNKVEIPVNILP